MSYHRKRDDDRTDADEKLPHGPPTWLKIVPAARRGFYRRLAGGARHFGALRRVCRLLVESSTNLSHSRWHHVPNRYNGRRFRQKSPPPGAARRIAIYVVFS